LSKAFNGIASVCPRASAEKFPGRKANGKNSKNRPKNITIKPLPRRAEGGGATE